LELETLLMEHGGFVAESQNAALAAYADQKWDYDTKTQKLSFGDGTAVRAGILGTYSAKSGTWLWAWANRASNFPPAAMVSSQRLHSLGQQRGINRFTSPEMPMVASELPELAICATGLLGARAYYLGRLPEQVVMFTLEDEAIPTLGPASAPTLVATFLELISRQTIVDHKRAFIAYVTARGLSVRGDEATLLVPVGAHELVADFDAQNRLTNLSMGGEESERSSLGAAQGFKLAVLGFGLLITSLMIAPKQLGVGFGVLAASIALIALARRTVRSRLRERSGASQLPLTVSWLAHLDGALFLAGIAVNRGSLARVVCAAAIVALVYRALTKTKAFVSNA
jgi:hypothetical protein